MIALRFTEWLEGRVALGETACEIGAWSGEPLALQLTLSTSDLEKFDASADRLLQVEGEIRYRPLGGRLAVRGTVNQLVDVAGDPRRKSMPYRLEFTAADGRPIVLSGVKWVIHERSLDAWKDTTTLYVLLQDAGSNAVIGAGIVYIGLLGFLRQFTTYHVAGGSWLARRLAPLRFYSGFLGKLWQVYGIDPGRRR